MYKLRIFSATLAMALVGQLNFYQPALAQSDETATSPATNAEIMKSDIMNSGIMNSDIAPDPEVFKLKDAPDTDKLYAEYVAGLPQVEENLNRDDPMAKPKPVETDMETNDAEAAPVPATLLAELLAKLPRVDESQPATTASEATASQDSGATSGAGSANSETPPTPQDFLNQLLGELPADSSNGGATPPIPDELLQQLLSQIPDIEEPLSEALLFRGGDDDEDADGVKNRKDKCPQTPGGGSIGKDGCTQEQFCNDQSRPSQCKDADYLKDEGRFGKPGDCVWNDRLDLCTSTPEDDSDGDGVGDGFDQCPGTLADTAVNTVGCSQSQFCTDFNRRGNCQDADFMGDETGLLESPRDCRYDRDLDICEAVEKDADADGVIDRNDKCPDTDVGSDVDGNGCSFAEFCASQERSRQCNDADYNRNELDLIGTPGDCAWVDGTCAIAAGADEEAENAAAPMDDVTREDDTEE